MCAQRHRARKGRPRQPIPKTLPGNLYDYADGPAPALSRPRGSQAYRADVGAIYGDGSRLRESSKGNESRSEFINLTS